MTNCSPGYPICDNSLVHNTPPVAPHAAPYHAAPAWNHGAHSYAYQSAPAYNHWNPAPYHSYEAPALHDFSTNDINGPGGDKYPAGKPQLPIRSCSCVADLFGNFDKLLVFFLSFIQKV